MVLCLSYFHNMFLSVCPTNILIIPQTRLTAQPVAPMHTKCASKEHWETEPQSKFRHQQPVTNPGKKTVMEVSALKNAS